MFKTIALATLLALGLTLAGCGNSRGNIDGSWTATLTNPDNSPAFAFNTMFTGSGGSGFTIASFTFTSNSPCFVSGQTTETGSVSLTGDYNGHVSGSFNMVVTTTFAGGTNSVLTLQGVVTNGTITGTWTLTGGAGCSGNGLFTATKH